VRGWAIFCAVLAIVTYPFFYPRASRERRLRRHGRVITAVCREHLNAPGEDRIRVRCGYRPDPDKGEVRAVVRTHERIPQVGDEFKVIYDPRDPRFAENLDVVGRSAFGREDILVVAVWAVFFLVGAGCAASAP